MGSVIVAVDDAPSACPLIKEAEENVPLLPSHQRGVLPLVSSGATGPQIVASTQAPAASKSDRLASLDVFRGLTVAVMILVDDAGGAFPMINHSPWFGVTLADFVMPAFLFITGISASLVFKKVPDKRIATRKVITRTFKLFILGIILQGGYFHGNGNLTYGVDLDRIRLLGVLQRIAVGYFLAAISEIWLVRDYEVVLVKSFVKKYYAQWIVAAVISALYLGLLYGLYVPNWEFEVTNGNSMFSNSTVEIKMVHCNVGGSLGPPCNSVGLIDRTFLGVNHLYQRPVYRRTKDCSVNSPDYGALPPNAPSWCLAPFDPEGILSTLMASVSSLTGLQFGHIIVNYQDHSKRMLSWSLVSLLFTLSGFFLGWLGIPLSKPLYTLSYMFLTAGASGLVLSFMYYIIDILHMRTPFIIFQWMGLNALMVFALAASDLFTIFLQGFYWKSPANNLVDVTEHALQTVLNSKRWGTLAFVLLEILFWCLVTGFLHIRGVYFKL